MKKRKEGEGEKEEGKEIRRKEKREGGEERSTYYNNQADIPLYAYNRNYDIFVDPILSRYHPPSYVREVWRRRRGLGKREEERRESTRHRL
jgi:hypothetical protein